MFLWSLGRLQRSLSLERYLRQAASPREPTAFYEDFTLWYGNCQGCVQPLSDLPARKSRNWRDKLSLVRRLPKYYPGFWQLCWLKSVCFKSDARWFSTQSGWKSSWPTSPEANNFPSGLKSRQTTQLFLLFKLCMIRPVRVSHIATSYGAYPTATFFASGESATLNGSHWNLGCNKIRSFDNTAFLVFTKVPPGK